MTLSMTCPAMRLMVMRLPPHKSNEGQLSSEQAPALHRC